MRPVREKVGALPSPGLASLLTQAVQIWGISLQRQRGQQELKVFRSYISLYMVLSIVSAKYSQAKPGGDFSALMQGHQPLHSHLPLPQSNTDVNSHNPKSRMPVNPLSSHCRECEPSSPSFSLSGVHNGSSF